MAFKEKGWGGKVNQGDPTLVSLFKKDTIRGMIKCPEIDRCPRSIPQEEVWFCHTDYRECPVYQVYMEQRRRLK